MLLGVAITMGGQDWIVPPLTLGQLRRLMPKVRQLNEVDASMGETQIAVLVEIVTSALQRNYPEMTPEKVENLLDLGNASAVLNAVLTGSGLKPVGAALGEAIAPGASSGAENANTGLPLHKMSETATAGEKSMAFSRPPADIVTRLSTK
jgi:hypothetical protein